MDFPADIIRKWNYLFGRGAAHVLNCYFQHKEMGIGAIYKHVGTRTLAVALWLLAPLCARAQDEIVPIRHYDRTNGLPAKKMYNIVLDRDGFLWFAAENGVFRFNGKTFYPYTTKEGLCDNDIIEIFSDRHGNIWCTGYNGKISVIENGVVNTEHPVAKNWNSRGFIFDMAADSAGNLYMAGEQGEIYRVDTLNRVSKLYLGPDNIFALGHYGKPYAVVNKELVGWDSEARRLVCLAKPDTLPGMQSFHVSRNDGSFWLHTQNNVLVDWFAGTRIQLPGMEAGGAQPPRINMLARINARYLFIGFVAHGPLLYDFVAQRAWPVRLPPGTRVVDACEDPQGNIWLSAYRDGLFVIRPVTGVPGMEQTPPEFSVPVMGAFRFRNETLVLTTTDQLLVERGGRVFSPQMPLRHKAAMSDNVCFVPLGNRVFFSTTNATYWYGNETVSLADELHVTSSKEICVYRDSLIFSRTSYKIVRYGLHDDEPPLIVCDERAFSCCIQGTRLWIGVKDGLKYYHIRSGKTSPVLFRVPKNGRIEDIHPLGREVLALATSNHGVMFVRNGELLGTVDVSTGLYDDDCKELIPCPGGLVVRHPLGLSLIDFGSGQIRATSQWQGIPISSVNGVYVYGDTVLLSSSQGLLRTRIDALFEKIPERRSVKFLQVMSGNYPVQRPNIELSYDQNKLKVDYALPEYDQPYLVHYYWRINGGAWNQTTGSSLELADLSSGDYVLQLRARAPGFDYSPISELRFHVATPFWRTWLFMVFVLLLLVGLIWGTLRQRYIRKLRVEREKASIRHQLMTFEQKALNAMMNPHFVFNALGSIQHLLNTAQTQQANDYLVKFSRLIRKSLETSRQEFCFLDEEIERLTLYLQLEKMRLGDRMVFDIDVCDELDPERVKIPTMILQPYIENAVIHGLAALRRGGALNLGFCKEKDALHIVVQDNGRGFDTRDNSKKHTRFGLSATEKRLELLTHITGKIYRVHVVSPIDAQGGTRVELFFPL